MSVPVPDLDQRREALDPRRSFIVQAPAGSGKTELLIQRYLLLLARVNQAEEIVAVTFTKKAAGEMRERVLQALVDTGAAKPPRSEHEQRTLELAAAALRRDREAGWDLIDNPSRLRILTIDALCAGLTRQMPLLSGFGAQPEMTEDASPLYLEAARATLALVNDDSTAAADVENLLVHLDNDVARAEGLIADMLARRDQWLRPVHGRERDELEAVLRHARELALRQLLETIPQPAADELSALAAHAFGNLGLGAFAGEIEDWVNLAGLFLTADGSWRKRLTRDQGFSAGKAHQAWKERALALFSALESGGTSAALDAMRRLPPPCYSDSQWQALGAILRLLPLAVAQLKLVFQSRRQVDFTEVAQGALLALGTDEAPTDLALALDYRIQHLLIDEFQDTSISQFQLVERLTAGWLPDDGRTLFAVGDPMQSIYRFREAEVGLFLRARAEGIAGVALHPVALSANFRSQSGIVEWVNAAFGRILPGAEDMALGAVPYTVSVATRDALPGAAVQVHALLGDDGSEEARRVTEIVQAARAADPAVKVAILTRTRGHLRDIVPALKAAALRFRAIDIEALGERPVVQDLLALTRALAHPGDRVAWLALLRAPWCGLTLADLHALAAGSEGVTLWDAMGDEARLARLSAEGRARLARVRAALRTAMLARRRGPLREQVAGAWIALGGPACVGQPTDLEDAEVFFRHLDRHEEAGELPQRDTLEQGLEALHALPDVGADDSLQIMTVHKAKGLEFDVVIVPGLARNPRSDDKKLLLWAEQPAAHGGTGLLLAPINAAGDDGDAIYRWIAEFNARRQALEDGRLLYVAATRARRQLHLLGSVAVDRDDEGVRRLKPPPARSLLGKLWPVVEAHYRSALDEAAEQALEQTPRPQPVDQPLRRLPAGWCLPGMPPAAAWTPPPDPVLAQDQLEFSWSGETARQIGSVVHRWLQRIAGEGCAGWDAARIHALGPAIRLALQAEGVGEAELADATGRAQQALILCLGDERGRWLLSEQPQGRSEWRLSGVDDGRLVNVVIDRSFVDADGTRWIIDYKTSRHEGGDVAAFLDNERERYRAQLERYARLLHAAGESRIRLGLYFPLLSGWRDWEYRPR
ncbi:MAG: UvrD-helicase domain-containing protein [Betaproteobacteria bacterium]